MPTPVSYTHLDVYKRQFVAGSGYDLFGTSKVGLRTYWHNRVGLALPEGAPAPAAQSPRLDDALPWLAGFGAAGR